MAIPIQKIPTIEEAYSGTIFGSVNSNKEIQNIDVSLLDEIIEQAFKPYTDEKL